MSHSISNHKARLNNDFSGCFADAELNVLKPVKRFICMLDVWSERREERKQLAQLNTRLLKDMGISSADAMQESAKPFWRA